MEVVSSKDKLVIWLSSKPILSGESSKCHFEKQPNDHKQTQHIKVIPCKLVATFCQNSN